MMCQLVLCEDQLCPSSLIGRNSSLTREREEDKEERAEERRGEPPGPAKEEIPGEPSGRMRLS